MHRSLKLKCAYTHAVSASLFGLCFTEAFHPESMTMIYFSSAILYQIDLEFVSDQEFFFFFPFQSSGIEDLRRPGAVLGCLQTLIYLSYTTTNFSRPPGFTHEKRQGSRKLLIVPVHITSKWETGVKNQGLSVIRWLLKITILTVEMGVGFQLCRFPKCFICQLP